MTLNELQMNCVKSLPPYLTRGDKTLLALLGLNSAAGDLWLACIRKPCTRPLSCLRRSLWRLWVIVFGS